MLHPSLEENSPTKSVYQLLTNTHYFKMCHLYVIFVLFKHDLQGELGSHAQNIQQPHGMRSFPKIQEILFKLLLDTRQDNLNIIALYPKRSAINWNNFVS